MRLSARVVTAPCLAVTAVVGVACAGADSISSSKPGVREPGSVSVSPKVDTIDVGGTQQFVARVRNAPGAPGDASVSWRSVDPAVASVSSLGMVAGVSVGSTWVIASAGGTADTAVIVVQAPAPSLSISPGAISVILGDSIRLTASPSAASATSLTEVGVRWATSDSTIARVSPDGVVTASDTGTTTVSAHLHGASAIAEVRVARNTPASVTISPGMSSVYPGQTQQLTATALDANGRVVTGPSIKWTSSDPSLAAVSDAGLVTGVAKGTAIITAQVQGRRATAGVNVLAVPVASVSVSLPVTMLSVGQTIQATATVMDAQGNVLTGRPLAWQSSNPAMATVNATGLVTALAKSTVTISAISDGKVGSAPLTVSGAVPTSMTVTPSSVSLVTGQSAQLVASVLDASGAVVPNRPVVWSSENSSVASVSSDGLVFGAGMGTTVVHASADGLTASVSVSVTGIKAVSVSVLPQLLALTVGDTSRLVATVRAADSSLLSNRAVTWSSSNPASVTISPTGLVTAGGAGTATINAQADGISATVPVTVAAPPVAPVASISVTLGSTSLVIGQTTQATATLRDAAGNVLSGRTVAWSSANPEVASVSSTGWVTAVSGGSASVIAKSEGQSGAATVSITTPPPAPVATVTLGASSTTLLVGQTAQVTATLSDAMGSVLTGRTIGWTSSNPLVATVSPSGLVTALSAGGVTVTATSEGRSGSVGLTISSPPPPASCSMVTDWNARPTTAMAKPGYLAPVTEPDFGTRLVRITGDPGTPITLAGGGTAGTWGNLAGDAYAKEPVWNADQSLMVLRVMDSPGGPLFLDGNTYQPLFRRGSVPGTFGPKWHPTNPDLMVYINANGSVGLWNVRTQATSLVYSTSAYNNASPGAGEGNVSANGYMVVQANRNADGHKVAYAVDVTSGARGGDIDLTNAGVSAVDWVSVSQLGGYVVVDGTIDGAGQRVKAWNRATGAQTAYWPTNPMGHFDLGVNAAGREVAFGAASGGAYPTRFVTLDLGNGTVAPMSPATSWDWHASTRNTRRQGWGYASTNNLTSFVLSGEIYALKLDGSQSVERYGHFRSNQTDYEAAPFPSPSPDGKRIVFRSNWGASSGRPVQTYVFDTRSCP